MKPISIVFLIISVILIAAGLLTCSVAKANASSQGIQLYDVKDDRGEIENTFDFSNENVGKIEIKVADADVKIVCGADSNKIVINNFSSTGYVCQVENKALVMETGFNVLSLTDLAQGEIRFKGFRYYINDFFSGATLAPKSVTVYVSDAFDIKVISVSTTNGDVSVEGAGYDADIMLSVENGSISFKDIKTNSSVKGTVKGSGDITLENVNAHVSEMECENGTVKGSLTADEITVNAMSDVELLCGNDMEKYNYDLVAAKGKITLTGVELQNPHKTHNPNLTNKLDIEVQQGNITITANAASGTQPNN